MTRFWLVAPALAVVAAGCGSSGRQATPPTATTPPTTAPATTPQPTTTSAGGAGALQAEANAAAAGDIPDNQAFLVFRNTAAGYSIKYPEGWAQQGAGQTVSFRDKNNIVRIVVAAGTPFTTSAVRHDLRRLHSARTEAPPRALTLPGGPGFQATYSTVSAPNAVTGKRVRLVVDRYYLWKGGRQAIVDLGTPVGVDNVDAYRLMIESFQWR